MEKRPFLLRQRTKCLMWKKKDTCLTETPADRGRPELIDLFIVIVPSAAAGKDEVLSKAVST